MASIVLGTVGQAAGFAFGGPLAPLLSGLGGQVGSLVGSGFDNAIFGRKGANIEGAKLADLAVQSSTYGNMIPIVYGTTRIAGNIIWSRPIKEIATTTTSGGKGGGAPSQSQTSFSYFVTLAIAICEGEINDILRVWADSKLLDPSANASSYRLYKGSEEQLPDSLIESFEGAGNVPAYRGLAYVVVEDFPLADFGNRIPNFTFEVKRRVTGNSSESAEDLIKAMIMIPGSGEFVYDTTVQSKVAGEDVDGNFVPGGLKTRINQNNRSDEADCKVALDQLLDTCPNLEWIGLVVTWFGDSIDAGTCTILPGVEYQDGATTEPDLWQVGSFARATARQISLDENGNPVYGGTPNDAGVLRYIEEIKSRGLKVMFYPMFFMDVENKPWRGRVTGSVSDVTNFFTKTNGYNAFITHYANLLHDKVDVFVIGSELIGLTKVKDGSNNFPAVTALVNLAATVNGIVSSSTKITYAADWSEYHHTEDGWYNLDPLWASPNIDFVGIDAYFPLGDEPQSGYDTKKVIDNWTSGEGYEWYYTDEERTNQAPLEAKYAWKNIEWWWKNQHVNPGGATTAWVPESKKIWFTEYGFPSVDGSINQPNVFYDPNSVESYFPRFSKGRVDFRAQRQGITGTELKWLDSDMIENKFVWTWDARPFPFWPDLTSVWTDGPLWKTGHWVCGKLGLSTLAAIVADLSRRAGLDDEYFDVSRLTDLVDGYVINRQINCRSAIEQLQKAYFFDAVESDDTLKFVSRLGVVAEEISENDLIDEKDGDLLSITRAQELELPQKVDVTYINKTFDYLIGNQHSQRVTTKSTELMTLNLPIVMADQQAKNIADVTLFSSWLQRSRYQFSVTEKYAELEPTDVVEVTSKGVVHKIRIESVHRGKPGILKISGVAEDISVYDFYNEPGTSTNLIEAVSQIGKTDLRILDIPALSNDLNNEANIRFAVRGEESGWRGSVIYRSDDGGNSYANISVIGQAATLGTAITELASGFVNVFDEMNNVDILLTQGELESVSELAVLNGVNIAKIGDEIIQFKNAALIGENKYRLSGLLRGRLGTENEISGHEIGDEFILLNGAIAKQNMPQGLIGLGRKYKAVSIGSTLGQTDSEDFIYNANALKPYSPVHISGGRDGSGNLTISWVRRTRVGGDWRDYVDVPLNEETESYQVEIMDGADVVRTIAGLSTPEATYSAANQTTDFGSPQSSVEVKIYQMSAIVGRGNAAIAVV